MHNQSIAQKIVNKKLFERNIVKLAFGGTAGMGSYRAPAAQNTSSAPAPAAASAAAPATAAKPAAPVTPARRGGRSTGSALPAHLRNTSPRSTPARPKKPAGIYTPQHPAVEIAGGFLSGMGQGIGNMAGAVKDFGVGVARGVTAPFAAEFGRDMIDAHGGDGDDYANDMYNVYENAWSDVANSFGRFVGVHDAWDPNTGQYRGAQPANSAGQQLDTDIEQKYFSNPADADLRTAFGVTRAIGEGAAAAVPLAAAAPAVGAQLMRIPGAAAAGNAVANSTNPIAQTARAVSNYGFGVPVGTPNNAALIASNMAQNITGASLDAAAANNAINAANELAQTEAVLSELEAAGQQNSPEFANLAAQVDRLRAASTNTESTLARFLPAYQLDNVTRDALGDWAPGVLDAVRMGSNAPIRALTGQYATAPAMARGIQTATDAAHSGLDQLDQYLNPDNPTQTPQQTPLQAAEGLLGQNTEQVQNTAQATPPPVDEFVNNAIPPDAPEEQRAAVTEATTNVQTAAANNPNVPEVLNDPEGEKAQEFRNGPGFDNFVKENAPSAPENQQEFGGWMGKLMTQFKALDPMSQIALGLGLGVGAIGVINSLMGGGIGSFLLGALGLGAAGVVGANAGMFGETAQNAATTATGAVSSGAQQVVDSVTGGAQPPENAGTTNPEQLLLNKIINAPLTGGLFTGFNRDAPGALKDTLATNAPALMELVKKPDADIKALFDSLNQSAQEQLLARLTLIKDNAPTEDDPKTENFDERETSAIVNRLLGIVKNGHHMQHLNNKSASQIVAQHLAIASLQKAARCWSGYEPVPGKKPYSNDSCRPIGGKKKKKKKAAK